MLGKRKKPSKNNDKQQFQKNIQKIKLKNRYEGFIPKKDWKIETICPSIDPQVFFKEYVAKRKPVLFKKAINQEQFANLGSFSQEKWNKQQIIDKAGQSNVYIEKRDNVGEQFGTGKQKIKMSFEEYLKVNELEKDKYYMTTQKIPYDSIGPKYLCESPMIELMEEEDYRIPLIGNLVPNQYNMWMGFSGSRGSSTGLHHDFHDNIYMLFKGKKQFNISAPVYANELETNGGIELVHKNGLIVYNKDIQSDGHFSDSDDSEEESDLQQENNFNNKTSKKEKLCPKEIKKRIIQLEEDIENLKNQLQEQISSKNEKQIQTLEQQIQTLEIELEDLLDKQLDFAFEDGDVEDDFDIYDDQDDEVDKENLRDKIKNMNNKSNKLQQQFDEEDEEEELEEPLQKDPDNFVITRLQKANNYKNVCQSYSVDIDEGQMLYLPASWYHQVNSFGDLHMAINLWMHPPNNLESFENPYKHDNWNQRYEKMKQNTEKYLEKKLNQQQQKKSK